MQFKDALTKVPGFRYILEGMTIHSSAGRRMLYNLPFQTDMQALNAEYEKIETVIRCLWTKERKIKRKASDFNLWELKDIRGTLKQLQDGFVLGDIELFEVKNLALLAQKVGEEMFSVGLSVIQIPELSAVVDILDPEHTRIAQFYVYDAYSSDLRDVRAEIREEEDEEILQGLRTWEMKLEEEVRGMLSQKLKDYAEVLMLALENLAELDVLLGKAEYAIGWHLVRPHIVTGDTVYTGLFHMEVWEQLRKRNKEFQKVDIRIPAGATVITGANMSGKSVLLKSLMLAQYMAQFGFWVPAEKASVALVQEIWLSMGDEQDENKGLSSYAAEMLNINRIIRSVREGKRILALIDEPARTTNPAEGKAIVEALLTFMTQNNVSSVITTHYGGLEAPCKRLRVKGFREEVLREEWSVENMNEYMDYGLEEDHEEAVPQEALRIAEILGIDKELIDEARRFLKNEKAV